MKNSLLLAQLLSLSILPASVGAFQIHPPVSVTTSSRSTTSTTQLFSSSFQTGVIKGIEESEFIIDFQQGGVRFALENVVVLEGRITHKPGSAEPDLTNLEHYSKLTQVPEAMVQETLTKVGGTVICTGKGLEIYADPGATTTKSVQYSPDDAIKNAMAAAGPAMDYDKIIINFCGGDDLVVMEVLEACQHFVLSSDINTKAKVSVHSMSYKEFPEQEATVIVIGMKEGATMTEEDALSGAEKVVAQGHVYWHDGRYWTVTGEDIIVDSE